MLGNFKDFEFSDISGVKIVAKKADMLGNLEVYVSRGGCWGWVIEGSKMHMIRIDFVTDFLWVKFDAKSAILDVN